MSSDVEQVTNDSSESSSVEGQQGGLLLYLLIEPQGEKVAVDLPVDATVQDLRRAAHAAGGPEPAEQMLSVGTERLRDFGGTPLCDTALVSNEVLVVVRRGQRPMVSCMGRHVVALLHDGSVVDFEMQQVGMKHPPAAPVATGATSVAAGYGIGVAVVDGELVVWGSRAEVVRADAWKLKGREIVTCAASPVCSALVGVVDSEGDLFLCGDKRTTGDVPPELRGHVKDVSIGDVHVVVLSRDGRVFDFGSDAPLAAADLGGRSALQVSAGIGFYAALLDDGTVRCFGDHRVARRCRVPADLRGVVACSCGANLAAALRADGSICWFGEHCEQVRESVDDDAGPFLAVAVSCGHAVALTARDTFFAGARCRLDDMWQSQLFRSHWAEDRILE